MLELNLPAFDIKVAKVDGRPSVFDKLRKRYVALTPEEWVRQHFINFLLVEKGYPEALIANEMQVNLNGQKKRCDSVVFDRMGDPLVIVEYKAPEVNITQKVFDQIARYNIVLRVEYLIVSNGLSHFCCKVNYEEQTIQYLEDIPEYSELINKI